jgi:hypothetical protein
MGSFDILLMLGSGGPLIPSTKSLEKKKNIRFALSTDVMNPFGERSSTHNTWPVLMTIYNLPLAMSQEKVPFDYHSNPRTEATWY